MNKKEILEQYVNNLSQYYNENKFEDFLLYFNSYNMDKPYLSDISKDSYILYTHIIEVLNENSYTFKFNDNKCYTIENINDKYLPIKVCFPYFIKDINIIIDNILDFLIKEKINFKFEISKLNKNYTFSMYLEKVNDLKMFISYLKQFRLYNKLIKNILNPFIPIYGGFGIIYEYEKFDYLSFILLNLTDFFSLNKYDNNYNSENFLNL